MMIYTNVVVLVLILFGTLNGCVGEFVQFGQCEDISGVQLDAEAASGDWMVKRRSSDPENKQCSTLTVSQTDDNIVLTNKAVADNFYVEQKGTATIQNGTNNVLLQWEGTTEVLQPLVLSVQYGFVAVISSCRTLSNDTRGVTVWQLQRPGIDITTGMINFINTTLIRELGLHIDHLEELDHTENACYELPDIPAGQPIILPLQCNKNILVVQNFDIVQFLGTWHEISSYYSENIIGTCARSEYSLSDGIVNVISSQVVNQTLNTISGNVSVIGENNTGILSVVLEVAPGEYEPQEFLILATDYTSYAVLYNCEALSENQTRVYSWILGRTSILSDASQQAVRQIINSQLDLNNAYYQDTKRADDDCFYYPEPDPGEPVIFRGQCNESIPVMSNFNAINYLGLWHNIESYSSRFQTGTCSNAYYSAGVGTEIGVLNTQVINQTLDTINGIAVAADLLEPAKLVVSFPVEGTNETVSANYWVLDTDYENYALVYTCINLEDNQRNVLSWKLSRTKSLSEAALLTINEKIDAIPVLDEIYYEEIDQSVEGCFYFPEPVSGVPVVFPGQCDESISVPDLDLTRFIGTWYEIEAYPIEERIGHCFNHEYTIRENNSLYIQSERIDDYRLYLENGVVTANESNSGRLTISVNLNGETKILPFWILGTDYDDYALAYSCVNINTDFRSIYSWKLSRNKELSAEANTAINEVISQIVVLDNDYYERVDQSDEACFYLPDLEPGEPIILVGQCDPNVPVVRDFNPEYFLNRWRLIESYPSDSITGTCNDATYTLLPDGTINVLYTQVLDQTLNTSNGSAYVIDSGKLAVSYPGVPDPVEYWILDTDYISYALLYSCINISGDQRRVWSWKLSRDKFLSNEAISSIDSIMSSVNVLHNRYFQNISHSADDCFYFPEVTGETVFFRGQCDETIPVVTDFDPARYEGLWYAIQSYPLELQYGTCLSTLHTLDRERGNIEMYNTQVFQQKLNTLGGTASLGENNTIAKLNVTLSLPEFDFVTPYWVLDTDYDDYALVYSCVNYNEEYMRVLTWKLSRSKSLSETAMQNINETMNNILILDDRYYKEMDQSEEGCFYFPEPNPGEPVLFPGQCNENMTLPDFDLTKFIGTWHEIEAYPIDHRIGQCINHEYTAGTNNSFYIQTEQINEYTQYLANGVVTADELNSGRLTISININDTEKSLPFWIISTDYDDYALAYSCVNKNDTFRNIYSWKLSKNKELSAEANTAINEAISQIDVLDNNYYEHVDQSDEACFYLPNLEPGEPVIFVGQCDPDVPVMRDFNPLNFLNRWRLIESYPSDSVTGTCNDATYSLLPDGTINVYNTQVLDQALDTVNGSAFLTDDGKLLVSYPGVPDPVEYWILDTDYSSYALLYSCVNLSADRRRVWSWKLSRDKFLSNEAISSIDSVMANVNVLHNRYFQNVSHSADDCFYFPEITGEPVLFRGQCDETIPVVTDFDPVRYEGRWYAIQSYPQELQYGTCQNAIHTLDQERGIFDIQNTQVFQQRQNIMNATATLADDNTAKLTVTLSFPEFDIVTPYWILGTDYDNYALIYSCVNYNDEYMRVGSWQLSRNRTLLPESAASIQNITNSIKVLDDRYLITSGHDDNDCFYYPELTDGRVILDGQCEDNNITVVSGFDPNQFRGVWYEIERFPSEIQTGDCAASDFTLDTTNRFTVIQSIVHNERVSTYTGPAVVATDGSGIITIDLSDDSGASLNMNLYILEVEYDEYALVYSCRNINEEKKQVFSWKLGRYQSSLSQQATDRIDYIVNSTIDLYAGYYETTKQNNDACFYYPRFEELPNYISLPGPCDERIVGVSNFDANRYSGRWIEISRYPQPFQIGTCDRAEYTVTDGGVDVSNTLVVNRTLLTELGFATVATNDGSGVLTVTFVVDGVENVANYYVLATDYETYSLVYSCRNLPDNRRQVFSWKLSRTRTLSDVANNAMDQVILDTQGLIEEYYTPTSQNDEDCFYVPEVNTEEAPVFRGQCESVEGLQNFNIQQFLGWWHEIKSYPRDASAGDCTSSLYESSSNQIQVVDTGIFDVTAEITTGTVQADTNGRLVRTLSNGQHQEMYVLATDYNTYAVLYSCENNNDEYRRVWSAFHSKTRITEFPETAQTVIDEVVDGHDLLYHQFYQDVDQSANACFHYPEQTGQQIILPGQCDENIPVQGNFDAARYTGRWYQTERYPRIHESGTCIGSEYNLDLDTGVVSVINWAVIGEELVAVEGTANITSVDGSAKLIVEIPIAGTEETTRTELYVLTTDYDSHSLLYTCDNIDEYNRVVGAWKFSRTRVMPPASTTAINEYMNTREELHQSYFISVTQHEDCEEPNSSLLIKSSIIVMLVCLTTQNLL